MKKTKSLTIVVLVALIVFGAFSLLLADDDEDEAYATALSNAENYMERGLYQLAIAEYDKAIAIKDSKTLRDAVLDAYEKRYEESTAILSDYIAAAESAIYSYSKNESYYMILAKAYQRSDDYQAAYKVLESAKNNGLNSEKITDLYNDIKYAFDIKWSTYTDFLPCVNGLYPAKSYDVWGYIDENGEGKTDFEYAFVSPLGEEGIRILAGEQNILMDENQVVRGKISFVPRAAGSFSEGLIAIQKASTFGYYNALGDYKFGEYVSASNFANGKAAVSPREGTWFFVDTAGKKIGETTYQAIKLNSDGSYLKDQVMLAKISGKFKLFDPNGASIGNFACDDVDIVTEDGLIAFKNNGKWGFVNTSGEIIIKAQFDNAKSFSQGLAAVCKNGKWGFIDQSGQVVIDCQFLDADYFNSEMNCFVMTGDGEWQMIDLKVRF